MSRRESAEGCPLVAHDWPTHTYGDGVVKLREPSDPVHCRGRYCLPPNSSRPYDPGDPATEATELDCPLDNPRQCPHWAKRMERYGERFDVPPRSRNATVEDLPGDIADDAIGYLRAVAGNVAGGVNVIIAGTIGAGKTCTAALMLVTYARLAGTDAVTFIGADDLFEFLQGAGRSLDLPDRPDYQGLTRADLLVIDDLGTELATSTAVRNWNRLIDERYQAGKTTIITTNSDDLDAIFHDERTRSRFMANCVIWRTGRGDMRPAAAVPADACDGDDQADPDAAGVEAPAACLPRPKTAEEWEAAASQIRARPNPGGTDLAYLLADHGIPAVATYRFRPSYAADVEVVLRDLLIRIGKSDRHHHLLEAIAWRSHQHGFEYPDHFALRDWRDKFADVPWSDEARSRYGIPVQEAVESGRTRDQE